MKPKIVFSLQRYYSSSFRKGKALRVTFFVFGKNTPMSNELTDFMNFWSKGRFSPDYLWRAVNRQPWLPRGRHVETRSAKSSENTLLCTIFMQTTCSRRHRKKSTLRKIKSLLEIKMFDVPCIFQRLWTRSNNQFKNNMRFHYQITQSKHNSIFNSTNDKHNDINTNSQPTTRATQPLS